MRLSHTILWLVPWLCISASPTCPVIPDALITLLKPGATVLVGEIHGTVEMPQRFADVICHARATGKPVKVGLELPEGTESGVVQWFASTGNPDDRVQLLEREFWQRDDQDGRSSQSMFKLLSDLHAQRSSLAVFTFDRQVPKRDQAMAQRIQEEVSEDTILLIFAGNIHSQTAPGTPWDPAFVTMGSVLRKAHPNTTGIVLRHTGGTAWICAPECGLRELGSAKPPADATFIVSDSKHDWEWWIGTISAAPPMAGRRP